jgi:drug/metabolite transporter, DME family
VATPDPLRRGAAALSVVFGAALWGTAGIAQELGVPEAAPPTVAVVRTLLGGASLIAAAVAIDGRRAVVDVLRRGRVAIVVAALAMGGFQLGYLSAIRQTGVALAVLVAIGSAPIWTGLYALLRRDRPSWRWAAATALSLIAAALLLLPGEGTEVDPAGVLLGLGAGFAYASYALTSKHLLDRGVAGIPVMGVAILGGGVLLSPVLIAGDLSWVVTPRGLVSALWLSLVAAGLSYIAFVWGLARLPTPTVTTLTLTEPLVATLLAVALLGERLSGLPLVGAVLLMTGLVLASTERPERGVVSRPLSSDP